MKIPIRPIHKRLLISLVSTTTVAALTLWFYPRDLNLSQVRSGTIKNEAGQPAQLLWWTPVKGIDVMQAPKKGDNVDGYIMPGDWCMDGRCFKVAEMGKGAQGMVRVRLYSEGDMASNGGVMYLARRKDLSQTISAARLQEEWSDRFLSR